MAFIKRHTCDACGESASLTSLVSIPYNTPLLISALTERHRGNIIDTDIESAIYEIIKCRTCGFLFQKYIPDEKIAERIYSYEESRVIKSLSKKRDAIIDYFLRHALLAQKGLILTGRRPHETRVLDFGSGWGHFLKMASAHGAQTEGVEISKERSEYSRSAGLMIHDSIEATRSQHDFIYSDQTFEHIPSPLTFLSKLTKRLAPHGIVYIAVPDCAKTERALAKAHKEIIPDLYPMEHINGFTNKSLRILAGRAGLEIIPPSQIFKTFLHKAHPTRDAHFFQEGLKAFYTQTNSTSLWLRKSS
jgi:2-polyprenyl-3-methyl-5-hydroxy-6-metoxy-1,4-benzoquinol methylase